MTLEIDAATLASFGVQNNKIICDTGEVLVVQQIARILPDQRLVCRCLINAQTVYVKLFIGLRANIHAARETSGIRLLQNAGILTPNCLMQTTTKNQPILVFNAIENAQNIEDFMRENDFIARKNMSEMLAKTVALHHQANLIQTDIHLKNFLVANNLVYTIDGDGVKQTQNLREKQQNLATLLSKFDVLDDSFMQSTVDAYCESANEKFTLEFFTKLYFFTQKIRQITASEYADKKVFRNCTDVTVTKNAQHFLAVSRHFNINKQQLDGLDVYLSEQANNIKNGNTCTIGIADFVMSDNIKKKVVIKRYNVKSFWHGVKFIFKQSRAAKSWANAHRLQMYNIATPQPLALLEQKVGMFKKYYFLSEFINAPDIQEFFANEHNAELKQLVANNVAQLFYKMSLLKIVHGDCKASNFKIANGQPILLDLDSLFVVKGFLPFTKHHVKDLKRFMQNWQNDAETTTLLKTAFKLVYEVEDDYFAVPNALDAAGIT